MDVGENPVGGVDVVLRDVFPNLVEICERIRMEGVAAHPPIVGARSFRAAS